MALNSFQKRFLEEFKGHKVIVKLDNGEVMKEALLEDADVYNWHLIFKAGGSYRFINMDRIYYIDHQGGSPESLTKNYS